MNLLTHIFAIGCLALLASCSKEAPPVSVQEFMDNPRLLEATMVRCAENRAEMKYVAGCMNARDAINRMQAAQERTRRKELEKQSERKRQALRRTQEAAAAARRRALEAQRRREEEEYLGLFEEVPTNNPQGASNQNTPVQPTQAPVSGGTGAEAPVVENTLPPTPPVEREADLSAVREELRRRQEAIEN